MRALVDIPEGQLNDLAMVCKAKKLPRAEVIRQAIAAYIAENKPNASQAFGLWAQNSQSENKSIDGLAYQEKVRAEW